ncbi:PEP-CTERM sorting domain-containing protein [Geobacter metallireducens]
MLDPTPPPEPSTVAHLGLGIAGWRRNKN